MKTKGIFPALLTLAMTFCLSNVCMAMPQGLQANKGYLIVSKATGQAMTTENYSNAESVGICQMPVGNYQSQIWVVEDMGNDEYRISNKYSEMAFNMPGRTTNEGAQMIQWRKENSDNSKWIITRQGDGSYRITPKMVQSFALTVKNGNTAQGTAIVQSTFNNSQSALWEFREANEAGISGNPGMEAAQPEKAFEAYRKMFDWKDEEFDPAFHNKWTHDYDPFWINAEIIETFIDAYERFGDEKYKEFLLEQIAGYTKQHNVDWSANPYNDDMMWAVIMITRAYMVTGEERFLNYGEKNFKICFDRGWSNDLGGGLWWRVDKDEKNSCANGPGAVAGCLLGQATGKEDYFEKAKRIIEWNYEYLSDHEGGIWDNVKKDGVTYNKWVSTYNQGTFIGACAMLYKHYNDQKFLNWAKAAADRSVKIGEGSEGYLNAEKFGVDPHGFKSILARWMSYFVITCNIDDYNEWLERNANSAWTNRNSDDVMGTQLGKKTEENVQFSKEDLGENYVLGDFADWYCCAPLAWVIDCTGIDKRQEKFLQEKESAGVKAAKLAIEKTLQEAKSIYDAGQDVYNDASWKNFVDAYNKAQQPNSATEVGDLKKIQYELRDAINGLKLMNPSGKLIEAEWGELENSATLVQSPACSDGIQVAGIGGPNHGKVTFVVTAEQAGDYVITLHHVTWDRDMNVIVNGKSNIVRCKGSSWDEPSKTPAELTVYMNAGENTIVFTGNGDEYAPNLDWFEYNRK